MKAFDATKFKPSTSCDSCDATPPAGGGVPSCDCRRASTTVRCSLGNLLAVGALNALAGGYYGLTGALGVPTEWLEGSPFADYVVPSLILLVVVSGSLIVLSEGYLIPSN